MKDRMLEIYKVEVEKYNKTRDIQWKVNIAIWTVLIVAIYAKAHNEFPIEFPISSWYFYGVYVVLHLIFIYKIHGSLDRSLNRMHDMAGILLKPEHIWNTIGQREKKKTKIGKLLMKLRETKIGKLLMESGKIIKWQYLQILITAFLICIFHIIEHKQPIVH